jgi:glyoxylase-like metal-dependent hydrolase (beta-lactamase superfamily II)
VYDESKECIIIDPGCYTKDEQNTLKEFISNKKLNPVKLINTHCHIDHILGNKFTNELWGIELNMHKLDLPMLENSVNISKMYSLENYQESPSPKHFLDEGERLTFGNNSLEVLFTPGHSPGHICLYNKENDLLIAGDLIFQKSIGRTDLPLGDYDTLIQSIVTKILPLADQTQIFCGHGPSTNLKFEKEQNPFLV